VGTKTKKQRGCKEGLNFNFSKWHHLRRTRTILAVTFFFFFFKSFLVWDLVKTEEEEKK